MPGRSSLPKQIGKLVLSRARSSAEEYGEEVGIELLAAETEAIVKAIGRKPVQEAIAKAALEELNREPRTRKPRTTANQ